MRQLFVQVPQGCGKTVLEIAKACDGTNLAQIEARVEQSLEALRNEIIALRTEIQNPRQSDC